jgi:serine/threonine protein kinase
MANKIGRFEIISQIAQSPFSTIYKALDPEGQQTVALKVVSLEKVQDRAEVLKRVFEEAEQAKPLNSPNIATLYGVGDEGDLLLAATEYIQGNSVATMLARKEGFSIWDIQDIARQVCHALQHAQVHQVVHQALEPEKIMVQWDGLVKVLGFGMSTMTAPNLDSSPTVPELLYYASPEQLCGETCDARSAIFSLGAVLYEMATDQKAFAGETGDQLREAILEKLPVQPVRLRPNLNPVLNELIMKTLAKSPDHRYQSAQDLVHDLEQSRRGAAVSAAAAARSTSTAKSENKLESAWQKPKATPAAPVASPAPKPVSPWPQLKPTIPSEAPSEKEAPAFAVDPLVAEASPPAAAASKAFSDISELPPLKEVAIRPPVISPAETPLSPSVSPLILKKAEAKPKDTIRELAEKALVEIRKTPPKFFLFALGGAAAIVALIVGGMALHNLNEERRDQEPNRALEELTGAKTEPAESAKAPLTTSPAEPTPQAQPDPPPTQTPAPEPSQAAEDVPVQEPVAAAPQPTWAKKTKSRPSAPAVKSAQMAVDSSPAGAQIVFDGAALCQSPCRLTDIAPGQHTISASKPGFASVTRNLSMARGESATVTLELHQLVAVLSVASTPAGAVIVMDGNDTGKLTPAQFSLPSAGTHTITLRRYGYLEATNPVNVEPGQTANFNLTLTHLGNTEEIRPAGSKLKKVFGHEDTSGMGIVSIKTQPKGAHIVVNNKALDKTSPFDFYLNPGTYVIDISMSGYGSVHRVIKLQEGEKLAIQETLPRE